MQSPARSQSVVGREKHPAWFMNLQANPQTVIEVGDTTQSVTAHQATAEEMTRLWPQLVQQAPFFADYQKSTTRKIPMVILQPTSK